MFKALRRRLGQLIYSVAGGHVALRLAGSSGQFREVGTGFRVLIPGTCGASTYADGNSDFG